MDNKLDILIIDDDLLIQQVISRILQEDYTVHLAANGEEGIYKAQQIQPAIIILDVKMPGRNGYEVCDCLRHDEKCKNIPIIFISGYGSLRDRMQGFEAGGDDYLVKPFEIPTFLAKIKVLIRYRDQQNRLIQQFEVAQKTAQIALIGSSELGMATRFVVTSYGISGYDELANTFFSVTDKLQLSCVLLVIMDEETASFSSKRVVSPLETELLSMMREGKRFYDFGCRTVINYPNVSLLVKNMPIEDMDRYGQIKDLLAVITGALDAKISMLNTDKAIKSQSKRSIESFNDIKQELYKVSIRLQSNQNRTAEIMRNMMNELSSKLPYMGLEEDQENYILDRIAHSIETTAKVFNEGEDISSTFQKIISELQDITEKQQELIEKSTAPQFEPVEPDHPDHPAAIDTTPSDSESYVMDVELF